MTKPAWFFIKVASEILNINLILRYCLSQTLKLTRSHLHTSSSKMLITKGSHSKGMLKQLLLRIIIIVQCLTVSHGDQSFLQYFKTAMCKGLKLGHFSNYLTKVVYPSFGRRSLNYT